MSDYSAFLASKGRRVPRVGRSVGPEDVHPFLHDWQRELTAWSVRTGRAALWWDTGLGKQQPVTEPVLTPIGWRPIGDLVIGDQVIGSDGHPTRVIGVFPQGVQRVYRLRLSDGTYVRAGREHLWAVRTKSDRCKGRPFRAFTTERIAETIHRDWQLPVVAPVQHDAADLPVDPYALGVLLGDGALSGWCISVCTDNWIGAALSWRQTRVHETAPETGHWTPDHKTVEGVRQLDLVGKRAWEKTVPAAYLHAPEGDRLALLQGLMDTDGYAMSEGGAEFSSTSRNLVDAVCELVRSLGGVARGIRQAASTYTHNGEKRQGRPAWRVNVKLPAPYGIFRLPRKAAQYKVPTKYQPARIIRSVEDEGVDEPQVCIAVDAPDHLYVTRYHIVTHNTIAELQFAKLAGRRSLIVAPLAVCHQTVAEAAKVDMDVRYVRSDDAARGPGVWITNYEMADRFAPDDLDAVILDEASVLKHHDAKTRMRMIRHFARVPHRLAATATPAPNDPQELTGQAEFLGLMTRAEMLASFYINDAKNGSNSWRLKGHARTPMFQWMAGWATALRSPADVGYPADGYELPPLTLETHLLPTGGAVRTEDSLFEVPGAVALKGVTGRAAVRKATVEQRCAYAAELVAKEPDEPWLIWCDRNDEADLMAKLIPGAVNVHGSLSPEQKAEALLGFARRDIQILITKPKIASFGMNFQHCARTAFVGLSDSMEALYQAVRRCWRYGQTRPVDAHIVLTDIEQPIADNVARKQRQMDELINELVAAMNATRGRELAA